MSASKVPPACPVDLPRGVPACLASFHAGSHPRKLPSRISLPGILLFCLSCVGGSHAQDFSELDAAAGKALFDRVWVSAPSSTAAADGLGPYYNARSCAACHPGGGGSSAAADMNLVINDAVYGQVLQARATAGLPAEAQATITETVEGSIALPGAEVVLRRPQVALSDLQYGALHSPLSLRRPPALAGVVWLERVPLAQLQALADPDDANGDAISGRLAGLAEAEDGTFSAGRFGWKALVPDLRQQAARALSLDIGLSSPLFPAAAGDCTAVQQVCQRAAGPVASEPEAPAIVLDLMLAYLEALPPPPSLPTDDAAGFAVFSALGCAACHMPELSVGASRIAPFSDLLLHDMGPGLADDLHTAEAAGSEWRTAPLWGLGQVSRYLHDARAATLAEAVLWHGGEAATSVAAYQQIDEQQRQILHAWLLGL